MTKQSRVSDSADGQSESASKKSAKLDDNHLEEVLLFPESTMPDAAEEASAAVESPKKKRKVVSDWSSSASRPKRQRSRPRKDAEKAEKESEKARKEAERQAEREEKAELARQSLTEERSEQKPKKMLKKNCGKAPDGTGKVGNVEEAQGQQRRRRCYGPCIII